MSSAILTRHRIGYRFAASTAKRCLCIGLAVALSGCALIDTGAYTNVETAAVAGPSPECARAAGDPVGAIGPRATFDATADRGDKNTLFILALSGGGSRAATWSAQTMLQLQRVFPDIDLLHEVDVISSVSGGSLPAAYYAISTDSAETPLYGRVWDEPTVTKVMEKNYIARWLGNWFWPGNIARYWFTAYDRTDIMAQTFADNLFDTRPLGRDLKMRDLRCERPYLVLNSANATRGMDDELFSFTTEQFDGIDSDISRYELARAVMASATFPGVFNDMTLRDFTPPKKPNRYVHVFDGGNNDNLGLNGALQVLAAMKKSGHTYTKLVVVLVDSYTNRNGVDSDRADPRSFFDFVVDTNFLNATGALLFRNRDAILTRFELGLVANGYLPPEPRHAVFYHITFEDVADPQLRRDVNKIGTNFQISDVDATNLTRAAHDVISPDNKCLVAIRALIENGDSGIASGFECARSEAR